MSKPDFSSSAMRGMERFNELRFWDAHEAWEEIWLLAESDVDQFLQGLIQLAAAYHHLQRGTFRGGVRLFDAALRRLEPFPPHFCGIDREEAVARAAEHKRWAAGCIEQGRWQERLPETDYPKLHLSRADEPPSPPSDDW